MGMADSTLWWVAAGLLVAVELGTGTFYLLMLALGAASGALAAHGGAMPSIQLVVAALVGGGAVAAWHVRRMRQPKAPPAEANRDVNLDIGSRVQVPAWNADGTARVPYRGATWSVRHGGNGPPSAGEHVIVAVQGSELVLQPAD